MSKEDMVKEAVEEAKAKAAEEAEKAGAEEDAEAGAGSAEEAADGPDGDAAEADPENEARDGEDEDPGEAGDAENPDESEGDASKTEKKKFFGKKNKKDKKDEKIEELTDRLTRQMAEFDNFRKRTEKEKSQMYEIGAKDIIEKILPVVDNFERGLSVISDEEAKTAFAEGMDKIYRQLLKTLEDAGVKPIEAVGKPFDPDFHNAVMHVDDESAGENIVVEEFQKGYLYRDSVVRHSMVKVAN